MFWSFIGQWNFFEQFPIELHFLMNQDIFQSGQNFSLALKKIKHEQFQTMFHFENVFLLCCRNGKISMRNFFILRSIVISSAFSLFSSLFSLSLSHAHLHMHTISHTCTCTLSHTLTSFRSFSLSLFLWLNVYLNLRVLYAWYNKAWFIRPPQTHTDKFGRLLCPNQQVRGVF